MTSDNTGQNTTGQNATGQDNADQIAYWNSDSGGKWVRNRERMDRTLKPFSEHVMSVVRPLKGETVLDVGCGCGDTSIRLSETGAVVVGVDVSQPMLAHAGSRPGAKNVRFVLADASSHDFGDQAFDLVFSRFGVMFFRDADAAFANIGRMVRPGGRIGFACWRPLSENPWMLKPVLIAKDFVDLPPRPGPEEPGPFSFSDPERVKRILTAGGFADIRIDPYDHDMFMGETVDDAVITAMEVGPVGGAAKEATDETVSALKSALAAMLAEHMDDGAIRLPGAIWCVTATKG
ncbi:class I SAM-dependent methyltransferase [Minwuia sp.]|uniref:class I SAM-dependent methyltransferase n=1 Tax=Minwuia sp. TaxID=2493630 RepID=UPI003A908EFD